MRVVYVVDLLGSNEWVVIEEEINAYAWSLSSVDIAWKTCNFLQ